MNKIKTYLLALVSVLCMGVSLTSCSDEMPAASYYTFTGKTVSSYLQTNENFSEFAQIVTRAGLMDLLGAYGEFTCFAATNDAVSAYLTDNGYATVDDIPVEMCDTIARTHLFSYLYYTPDFATKKSLPQVNMLRRWISVKNDTTFVDLDSLEIDHVDVVLNNKAHIINSCCNDSVENGVIHAVNAIMQPANQTLDLVMNYNPRVVLFSQAIEATGLKAKLASMVKDASWNPDDYPLCPGSANNILLSNGHKNLVFPPEERRFGYTMFVVPDDIIAEKLGKQNPTLRDLYDYACEVYDDAYPEVKGTPAHDFEHLTDPENPLNRFIAYHMLDRMLTYDKMICRSTIDIDRINPTEWYETMAPHATMKIDKATVLKYCADVATERNQLFVNRARNWKYGKSGRRGAMITIPPLSDMTEEAHIKNISHEGSNGFYYYVDDFITYDRQTQEQVFNDRMRIEIGTLFPELATNGILGNGDNTVEEGLKNTTDKYGKNYWFPSGYLENCRIVGEGVFHYQMAHNYYWSYEGDEFNLKGDTYDVSFRLPPVPDGQYEIRLGFCVTGTRGIAQIYLDGQPQGIPLDMRMDLQDPSIGTMPYTEANQWLKLYMGNEDVLVAEQKKLKNNGYYRGPAGVYNIIGTGHKDDDPGLTKSRFYDNTGTIRKVLCQVPLSAKDDHWLRFRSVYAEGGAELMIDYLEIVPKSVYGVDGEGNREDDL